MSRTLNCKFKVQKRHYLEKAYPSISRFDYLSKYFDFDLYGQIVK